MKMTARGSIAALMTCLAAAGAATPAVAQSVPVGVPLDAVETTLGADIPHVATGVPVPVVGAPEAPVHHSGDLLPTPLLPVVPIGTQLGDTLVTSPVPNLLGAPETDGEGSLDAPATTMRARTPGAVVGAPLTMPDGSNSGLPNLTKPELGLTAPEIVGAPTALLGLGTPR
uniref:ATP-binding protein n=1 Tax=Streptomyces sp. NBC_00049 TaxID=2903617 RepID=A0AAU2JWG7_9ACTN